MRGMTSGFRLAALAALASSAAACGSSTGTRVVTVPAGTMLAVELQETLSSASNRPGDAFTAVLVEPVALGGEVVIEAGSVVTGRVAQAVPSKKIGGRARLGLEFTRLALPSGGETQVAASFHSQGKSQTKKDAATIGGAAAGGALLGRIIGHDRGQEADGTVVGAVAGAAIGTGIAASNRGQDVTLAEGSTIRVQLDLPAKVPLRS